MFGDIHKRYFNSFIYGRHLDSNPTSLHDIEAITRGFSVEDIANARLFLNNIIDQAPNYGWRSAKRFTPWMLMFCFVPTILSTGASFILPNRDEDLRFLRNALTIIFVIYAIVVVANHVGEVNERFLRPINLIEKTLNKRERELQNAVKGNIAFMGRSRTLE